MFDFVEVKKAIIKDLKQICIQNYLILKEINNLPTEINLVISYNRLQISDELIKLNEDIEYSLKQNIHILISQSYIYNIDILSEYDQHYKNISNIFYDGTAQVTYNPKSNCPQNKCIDILYSLDNNIFYKLLYSYINKNRDLTSYKDYEYHYDLNLDYYIKLLSWKTSMKYMKLLEIVNLDNFYDLYKNKC